CLDQLVFGELDLDTKFAQRRRAAELQFEARLCLLHTGQGVTGVYGKTNCAARVRNAASDRLANPPRGVGGELEALSPVELFDRVHKTEIALLDQVQKRKTRRLILLRDRHDEAQVRLHEGALCLIAIANHASQLTSTRRSTTLAAFGEL